MTERRSLSPVPSARMERVYQILATLQRGIGGQCVLLANGQGNIIAQAGLTEEVVKEQLLPLILEEASITLQLGKNLGNGTGISLHHYEGDRRQIYVGIVSPESLVLVVMSRQPPPRRLGIIWLFLRRSLQELRALLEGIPDTEAGILTTDQARALGLWPEE
ncbi:MAG: hypothetical protein RMK65_12720 [Anaerolineae bacterium]|nr:hypothetical protein [Anaerolineae bacterium]MCX8068008.1 hypothetical protein [Anaerolineae bacterium]MDW7992951.1 hypothetical protein [Anaerolineae bacterium]